MTEQSELAAYSRKRKQDLQYQDNGNWLPRDTTGQFLDQLPSSSSSSTHLGFEFLPDPHQEPAADEFISYNDHQRRQLRLNDLGSIHDRNQQQLIQSWVGGRQSPQTTFSPTTPAFFSPSFLESLNEDDRPFMQQEPLSAWPPQHQQQHPPSYEFPPTVDPMMDARARTNSTSEPLPLFHSSTSASILSPPQSPSSPTPFIRSSSSSLRARPIPEEEDDYTRYSDLRSLKAGLATARLMQSSANASRLKPLINTYLQSPDPVAAGEKTVILLTSKVAQKSYGTEKRFLCPPPTAILMGTSWWKPKLDESGEHAPPLLTVCISGEATSQSGQVEWYNSAGAAVGQTGHPKSPPLNAPRFRDQPQRDVDWYHNHDQDPLTAGRCVAKNLYINDADEKRKRVECLVRIQLGDGSLLGTLASKAIKVISKPSKKRQSVKNMELCIHHGTTVSLFNRIRSQTVSTKYLGVSCGSAFSAPGYHENSNKTSGDGSGTCFVARTTSWDPFVIWVVDTTRAPGDVQESERPEDYIGHNVNVSNRNVSYPPPPAIALRNTTDQPIAIHYNQHIVLQCLTTGLVSPVMIIRKVDKASTVVGGARCPTGSFPDAGGGGEFGDEMLGDPVSQLHKVALQIVQDPSQAVQHRQQQMQNGSPDLGDGWMLPKSQHPITYLACLNDMVGMHKTVERRKPVLGWEDVTSQEGGKVVRKRRVSTDQIGDMDGMFRRRVDDEFDMFNRVRSHSISIEQNRRPSTSRRLSVASTSSTGSNSSGHHHGLGAYWSEDVSDAAVWTIVGTGKLSSANVWGNSCSNVLYRLCHIQVLGTPHNR
ncbi:hypothetical protein BJV82DRAFT_622268 [Fennellomyces sp. T-0311]|nr:hypothetical protein BJV82DRAFT_622268 [Fennellomyces sp. T-0311]